MGQQRTSNSEQFPPEQSSGLNSATAWNDRAIDLAQQGRFAEAVRGFEQAIQLHPEFAEAHNNLGNMYWSQRQFELAAACYRRALELEPNFPEPHHNLGNILKEQGKLDEAVARYRQALSLRPNYANALNSLGNALKEQGAIEDALTCYQQALRIQPAFAEAHNNMAAALLEQDRIDEAFASCRQALQLRPNFAEAYVTLGAVLLEKHRIDEAVASYRQALRWQPGLVEAHTNLGIALTRQGNFEEAHATLQRAIGLKPDHADAHNALGTLFREYGQMEKALASYQDAIHYKPGYAEAHWNEGLTHLLLGDMDRGWAGFKWVWQCRDFSRRKRTFPQPEWDGAPLTGRTILLHSDQGLGDTIQFIRYAALLKEQGGRVLVECPQPLHCLLTGCAGIDQLLPPRASLPVFDVHAPLLCLPAIMGTTLATVPAAIPYLHADPERVRWWGSEVARRAERREPPGDDPNPAAHAARLAAPFKVGIAWQGNPRYRLDHQRSIPLRYFAPLAQLPGLRLFSVQKGHGSEQLAEYPELPIIDLGAQLESLQDTAAVLTHMDLVITCDSAIAHLAGALGVPVWVALPFIPDWRWMLQREDSPWYPTMRLFRQKRIGDWGNVFQRIEEAMKAKTSGAKK